jgi:hypothetical protein
LSSPPAFPSRALVETPFFGDAKNMTLNRTFRRGERYRVKKLREAGSANELLALLREKDENNTRTNSQIECRGRTVV